MAQSVDPSMYTTPFQLTRTTHRTQYAALSPFAPENSQRGKSILITGGGTGIGAAAAKTWVHAGAAKIALASRRVDRLEEVAASLRLINPRIEVVAIQTDVTVEEEVQALFEKIHAAFGRPPDVVLSNAGYLAEPHLIGESVASEWWKSLEINIKGHYLVLQNYVKSLGQKLTGTLIVVSSGMAGVISPGSSAYSIGKLAQSKLTEYADKEYPTLRIFTLHPGIVATDLMDPGFAPFALDEVEMAGQLSLYLAQPRADYLRGSFVSVNWDVMEMESHKEVIVEKKLLKMSWLPVLPVGGGQGLY